MMADRMTLDASTRPTASPIVRVLNEEVRHYHRWCTPSTLVDQERIEDFYASDVSISAGFFGTLVDHTGVFGEAERFAAAAQGADRTMFSVHGSTGSNFVVLRMLALERPDALVLVARNCHHSTINAIKALRARTSASCPRRTTPEFEAVLPPSVDQVLDGLRRYPEALAVVYTSPTYEGLCANTHAIAAAVHDASDHAMLFVDEAWGGHLHFHPELPPSAMDGGADISVQSTHKLAGGLQQTGLIHWREGAGRLRADGGGVPRVRHHLAELPPARLARTPRCARSPRPAATRSARASAARAAFKALLRERLPLLRHLDDPAWVGQPRYAHVAGCDKVKTTVALSGYALQRLRGLRGAGRARHRGREGGRQHGHVHHDVPARGGGGRGDRRARSRRSSPAASCPRASEKRMPDNPFRAIDDRPVMHPYHARRYAKAIGQEVPLDQAVGRVAAEEVEVYPPGIPVILEGFRVARGRGPLPARGARPRRRDRRARHVARDAAGALMELHAIGRVESPLTDLAAAPKQGDEGAPEAWLVFDAGVADALDGIAAGDELIVLTWLDRAARDVLRVHPRGDLARPATGVFATRSPDRPNPIGLHRVTVLELDGLRLRVRDLEALDGTPVVDVKPVLGSVAER